MVRIKALSRRWLPATLFVILGSAVCVRLGFWQLDRLESRRAFNTQVESMRAAEALDLGRAVPSGLAGLEWRRVVASGRYDFENQVALRNQVHGNELGYHLFTPLNFEGGSIFVDRGWIPAASGSTPQEWRAYDEPGLVEVRGQLRAGQGKPSFGGVDDPTPAPGGEPLAIWNNFDLDRISGQMPYPVLEVYIQPDADASDETPPIPSSPEIELTEGPHFGYALQWFSFAAILLLGYPFYLRKQDPE